MIYEPTPQDDKFGALWVNPEATQTVVRDLLAGKHIDQTLAESFLFLEKYQSDWTEFFGYLGYRLQHGEFGTVPFYYLSLEAPGKKSTLQCNLSRESTFLGFYLVLHFMKLPPGNDTITGMELLDRLIQTYSFSKLRSVFYGKSKFQGQVTETQTEKIKKKIANALEELWKFRFVEVEPGPRSPFETLLIKALPAIARFIEIAQRSLQNDEKEDDFEILMSAYLGAEPNENMEDQGDESDE